MRRRRSGAEEGDQVGQVEPPPAGTEGRDQGQPVRQQGRGLRPREPHRAALTREQADERRRRARAGTTDEEPPDETPEGAEVGAGIAALAAAAIAPARKIAALDPPRQLDFWVGTWDVFLLDGRPVGTNRIESRLGGHLIFEDWTSARGGRGQSMNYFDPSTSRWVQVWVDGGGEIIVKEGGFRDGAMRLEGRHVLTDGEVRSFRSSLTPNADGSIRQLIEELEDDGATWKTWFDGRYVRREATAQESAGTK